MRRLDDACDNFVGLSDDIDRYELLRLVKRVGRELGFTPICIQHLEFLINHTRDGDWREGSRPIVYKTVAKTALELGISERQVNNREQALHALGALTWCGLGNHRRTGMRNDRGRIIFAYGVDLSPLAMLYDELRECEQYVLDFEQAWETERRRLSTTKRRVRGLIAEAMTLDLDVFDQAAALDGIPRVRATTGLDQLQAMTGQALAIEQELDRLLEASCPVESSDMAEENFRHKYITSNPLSERNTCNRPVAERPAPRKRGADVNSVGRAAARVLNDKRKNDPVEPVTERKSFSRGQPDTGIQHVKIGMALEAMSERFRACLPSNCRQTDWTDLVVAAEILCAHLGINRHAWIDACAVMGRNSAAIAVLVIDRNIEHPENPVRNPGGALRGMTDKAEADDLHLHRSIFGILDRQRLPLFEGGVQ